MQRSERPLRMYAHDGLAAGVIAQDEWWNCNSRQAPGVYDWPWALQMAFVSETKARRTTQMGGHWVAAVSRGSDVRFEVCASGLWVMQGRAEC